MADQPNGTRATVDLLLGEFREFRAEQRKAWAEHGSAHLGQETRITRLESQMSMRSWAGSALIAIATALGIIVNPQGGPPK